MRANEKEQQGQFPDHPVALNDSLKASLPVTNESESSMTKVLKHTSSLRVEILGPNSQALSTVTLVGREAWTCRLLLQAGKQGISSLNHPGARLSHYIFRLRSYGFAIETVYTKHGGEFPGSHAVYVNHSDIRVIEDRKVAA